MINSLFVINRSGEIFFEKHFRGMIGRKPCELFWAAVLKSPAREVEPVIRAGSYTLINISHNELYFLAAVKGETVPLSVIEFLHRLLDTLTEYFRKPVTEEEFKQNFLTVYEVLDEMMDNGFAVTTELNILRDMVKSSSTFQKMIDKVSRGKKVSDVLPLAAQSSIPWRRAMVAYANNEIAIDVVEEVDAIFDGSGMMVKSEVNGYFHVKSHLSGVPDVLIRLADPKILDRSSVHPCVRYGKMMKDGVLSFVPPDGEFILLKYTTPASSFVAPVYCNPQITIGTESGRVNVMVGLKGAPDSENKFVDDVELTIPFPSHVSSVSLNVSAGKIVYDEVSRQAKWHIGKIPRDRAPCLNGTLQVNASTAAKVTSAKPVARSEWAPTVSLRFTLPGTTASGVDITDVRVLNETSKSFKGVRYTMKAGQYQFRSI
mmetsp:Transcript_37305/g.96460  ORF Transcript_37305/g.96460 Transcript_37305/m.96460 type:complete len:430 (-) Transcript_37305:1181-2470(-)